MRIVLARGPDETGGKLRLFPHVDKAVLANLDQQDHWLPHILRHFPVKNERCSPRRSGLTAYVSRRG
jgi:hypothetical protein